MIDLVAYISEVKVEPAEEEPVFFGVHSEITELYNASPDSEKPHSSTLDYIVAAADGSLPGTFRGALRTRQVTLGSLAADTIGEIEVENKALVIKQIKTRFPDPIRCRAAF